MTDEQIMQALKCCITINGCASCPNNDRGDMCKNVYEVVKAALALITRQKEEIERLTIERDILHGAATPAMMSYNALRAEQAVAAATRAATSRRIFADIGKLCDEFLNRKILCHEFLAKYAELEKTYTEGKTDAEIH